VSEEDERGKKSKREEIGKRREKERETERK
jgi:hypothetical protein